MVRCLARAALLQALQQFHRRIAVRRQAQTALVLANAAPRGRAHGAVGRAAVKTPYVQQLDMKLPLNTKDCPHFPMNFRMFVIR